MAAKHSETCVTGHSFQSSTCTAVGSMSNAIHRAEALDVCAMACEKTHSLTGAAH